MALEAPAPGTLLQETDEWREYAGQDVRLEFAQGFEHRPTSNKGGVGVEAYVEHRAEAHVHLLAWVDGIGGPPRYACVTFGLDVAENANRPVAERRDVPPATVRQNRSGHYRPDCVQESVLVDVVQKVEPPKRIVSEELPSVVRLKPLDLCLREGRQSPDAGLRGIAPFAGSFTEGAVPVYVAQDRELAVLFDLIGHRDSKRRRQFEREVIKRRAETLKAISHKEREEVAIYARSVDPGAVIARLLRVGLLAQCLEARIDPPGHLLLDLMQMLLRPRELEFEAARVGGVRP